MLLTPGSPIVSPGHTIELCIADFVVLPILLRFIEFFL